MPYPKVLVRKWTLFLEFELAYHNVTIQYVSHYATSVLLLFSLHFIRDHYLYIVSLFECHDFSEVFWFVYEAIWIFFFQNNFDIHEIFGKIVHLIILQQKERISNYCLTQELFWLLRFRFYIFDGLCHSAWITFPGNIKGCVTLSRPLFLPHSSSRKDKHQHESASNFWTIVF